MNEIILHHYPTSPFSEKVRIALGLKQLAWRSVHIPIIMPKPDLMPLTGGYRKTPVMQIGADIYCDTQCILRELERRFPEPSLYRGTDAGTANALAFWADRNLFLPAVSVVMARGADGGFMTPEFIADRSKFAGREIDAERIKMAAPFMVDQLRAQLGWLASMLADDRPYLQGQQPTLLDLAAYHPCWFIAANAGADAAPLSEFTALRGWMERVAQIGHGKPTELDSKQALEIARQATSQAVAEADARDPLGRKPGARVAVVPDDNGRDPVVGELIRSTRDDIVIRRTDPQVGAVAVHFPRAGFMVQPASA